MSAPIRTCVGCRARAPKASLVRFVARRGATPATIAAAPPAPAVTAPAATVVLDPRCRLPCRGAYLHREGSCFDRALRRGHLARALRVGLGPAHAASLRLAFASQGLAQEAAGASQPRLTGGRERTEYELRTASTAPRTMPAPEDGRSEIPGEE